MSHGASQLLEQALRLSERDRGDLAARLIDSLDAASDDDDVESAWSIEIQERIAEIDQGRIRPVPWPEARRVIEDETQNRTDASDTP
jgi:putative addiction module component (TIGR02574 family)